jgi:hypothetical protein
MMVIMTMMLIIIITMIMIIRLIMIMIIIIIISREIILYSVSSEMQKTNLCNRLKSCHVAVFLGQVCPLHGL